MWIQWNVSVIMYVFILKQKWFFFFHFCELHRTKRKWRSSFLSSTFRVLVGDYREQMCFIIRKTAWKAISMSRTRIYIVWIFVLLFPTFDRREKWQTITSGARDMLQLKFCAIVSTTRFLIYRDFRYQILILTISLLKRKLWGNLNKFLPPDILQAINVNVVLLVHEQNMRLQGTILWSILLRNLRFC